jgi:hypothetical protein
MSGPAPSVRFVVLLAAALAGAVAPAHASFVP